MTGAAPSSDLILLDKIPQTARLIVNVGCGVGALGAAYKRRNPTCRYIGIESDPQKANLAATRLDKVYVADLDDEPLPHLEAIQDDAISCLVYDDVLGGPKWPWRLLAAQSRLLAPDGIVVGRVRNVEHWRVVQGLLRGDGPIGDAPSPRQTNSGSCTLERIDRQLRAIGLQLIDVTPYVDDECEAELFVESLRPCLRRLGIDFDDYIQRALPTCHIWQAKRQSVSRLHVVSTALSPVGGVSHVRVLQPERALSSDPGLITRVVTNTDHPPANATGGKIFIFHRPLLLGAEGLQRVRSLLQDGWIIVCEFDDHPEYIPVLQRSDVQNFRAVHAIQVATEPLADLLRVYNPEIAVFPNAVASLPDIRNYHRPDLLTFFYAGINRDEDWPPYIDAINSVIGRAQGRIRFKVLNDWKFFEALQTRMKQFIPLCDYQTYQSELAGSEISFMPLRDTPFNRCKSDLKFIEAGASRVTALASRVVYEASIIDGQTGLLFTDARELEHCLLSLLANIDAGRALADAARAYVASARMLGQQAERRSLWYQSLWSRRDELRMSLLTRIPELADEV